MYEPLALPLPRGTFTIPPHGSVVHSVRPERDADVGRGARYAHGCGTGIPRSATDALEVLQAARRCVAIAWLKGPGARSSMFGISV